MRIALGTGLACLAACAFVGTTLSTPVDDGSEVRARARAAVEGVLPLLQRSAQIWYEQRDCGSCHHQSLGTMTVEFARERGFEVDGELLQEQLARAQAASPGAREEILQGDAGLNAQVGQAYRLLASAASDVGGNPMSDARWYFIAGKQQRDGSWRSESHRPPLEDSEVTTTAIDARALQLYAPPTHTAEVERRVERAHGWLAGVRPSSSEERAMRLFGLAWTGGTAAEIARARDELQHDQRADGGWAQIATRASDAYATGQALVALNQAGGLAVDDAAYRRGLEFLLKTQLDDGTWLVTTRRKTSGLPYFETGFPHGEHQFISYAATCWAAMALCAAIEPKPSPIWMRTAALARDPDARAPEDGLTPLMLAALFGDLSDVRRELDTGADVDAASERGVTALMCAVDDPEKTQLLLDRGATLSARSALGNDALLLAAARDGGLASMKQLLARGADPKAQANVGTSAIVLAATAGDTAKVDALLAAGASVDHTGDPEVTALAFAVWQRDTATARHLLSRGAALDAPGFDEPLLIFAVVDGSTDAVRLLLAAGAPVDVRDSDGRTPLMWAATVDWGDHTVLEALLAKGCDMGARTENGDTALRLAEANGNQCCAELLRRAGATE